MIEGGQVDKLALLQSSTHPEISINSSSKSSMKDLVLINSNHSNNDKSNHPNTIQNILSPNTKVANSKSIIVQGNNETQTRIDKYLVPKKVSNIPNEEQENVVSMDSTFVDYSANTAYFSEPIVNILSDVCANSKHKMDVDDEEVNDISMNLNIDPVIISAANTDNEVSPSLAASSGEAYSIRKNVQSKDMNDHDILVMGEKENSRERFLYQVDDIIDIEAFGLNKSDIVELDVSSKTSLNLSSVANNFCSTENPFSEIMKDRKVIQSLVLTTSLNSSSSKLSYFNGGNNNTSSNDRRTNSINLDSYNHEKKEKTIIRASDFYLKGNPFSSPNDNNPQNDSIRNVSDSDSRGSIDDPKSDLLIECDTHPNFDNSLAHLFSYFYISEEELLSHSIEPYDPVCIQAASTGMIKMDVEQNEFVVWLVMDDSTTCESVSIHHKLVTKIVQMTVDEYNSIIHDRSLTRHERKTRKGEICLLFQNLCGLFWARKIPKLKPTDINVHIDDREVKLNDKLLLSDSTSTSGMNGSNITGDGKRKRKYTSEPIIELLDYHNRS
jgi:hypothetical protein